MKLKFGLGSFEPVVLEGQEGKDKDKVVWRCTLVGIMSQEEVANLVYDSNAEGAVILFTEEKKEKE
jgi:hypothetical protein